METKQSYLPYPGTTSLNGLCPCTATNPDPLAPGGTFTSNSRGGLRPTTPNVIGTEKMHQTRRWGFEPRLPLYQFSCPATKPDSPLHLYVVHTYLYLLSSIFRVSSHLYYILLFCSQCSLLWGAEWTRKLKYPRCKDQMFLHCKHIPLGAKLKRAIQNALFMSNP
jgi:hypothetical protein